MFHQRLGRRLTIWAAVLVTAAIAGSVAGKAPAFADGPATVHGSVTFAGSPVVGANVSVYPVGTTTGPVANASTDSNGVYSMAVPFGNWDFVFTPGDPLTPVTKANVSINGDRTLDVVIVRAGVSALTGRIVDDHGHPVPGATFAISSQSGYYNTNTDINGAFSLEARNGAYAVHLAQSYQYTSDTDVPYSFSIRTAADTFVVNGDVNLGDIALPAPTHITATVLDPDNHPVPNASISLNGSFTTLPGFGTILGIPLAYGSGNASGTGTGPDGTSPPILAWPATPTPITVSPPAGHRLLPTTTQPIDIATDTDVVVAYQANGSAVTLIGQRDNYSTMMSTQLNVAAPGVLGNDHAPAGTQLTAMLAQPPSHGTTALNTGGSFSYAPTAGFVGTDQFTYRATASGLQTTPITVTITVTPPPLPVITGISPTHGPITGGTSVTIAGTHLTAATAVTFGGAEATSFIVNSDTAITATAPTGTAGVVDVQVATSAGASAQTAADRYTYDPPPPIVTSISPANGPAGGGTVVTVTGTNLTGATAVRFGAVAATNVSLVGNTMLTATAPAGSGTVDVTVTTPYGTSATSNADRFTYNAGADLATTIITSANPVALGDAYTETVVVTNHGPNAATQAGTTITFSGASASILSATTTQGACSPAGSTVTCSFGTLVNTASATVVTTVEPAATGTIAAVTATIAHETDPAPQNTNGSLNVAVNNAHGCTMLGTKGGDTINGTNGTDVICSFGGDDHINGGNGDDTIYGGSGNDTIDGGNGADTIHAGDGGSTLIGGNGNDTIYGGSGNDTIYGDNGDDVIRAGDGNDTVYGGNGNDTIDAGAGNDVVDGGNGNDTCTNTEHPTSCTG
jgi:Ca2+-binding RTX toxin-like protein